MQGQEWKAVIDPGYQEKRICEEFRVLAPCKSVDLHSKVNIGGIIHNLCESSRTVLRGFLQYLCAVTKISKNGYNNYSSSRHTISIQCIITTLGWIRLSAVLVVLFSSPGERAAILGCPIPLAIELWDPVQYPLQRSCIVSKQEVG